MPAATAVPLPPLSGSESRWTRSSSARADSERVISAGAPSATNTSSSTCSRVAPATAAARAEPKTGMTAATVAGSGRVIDCAARRRSAARRGTTATRAPAPSQRTLR